MPSTKDNLNESIIAENDNRKVDMANKASTLSRCTEAVRNARDQMRIIRAETKN